MGQAVDAGPLRIDHDVQGLVPDPREPDRGLVTAEGLAVIYAGRVDLLALTQPTNTGSSVTSWSRTGRTWMR